MTELRRGQRQLGDGLTVSCQVGERERAMLPVTRHCTALLERSGSLVSSSPIPVVMTLRGGAKDSCECSTDGVRELIHHCMRKERPLHR